MRYIISICALLIIFLSSHSYAQQNIGNNADSLGYADREETLKKQLTHEFEQAYELYQDRQKKEHAAVIEKKNIIIWSSGALNVILLIIILFKYKNKK